MCNKSSELENKEHWIYSEIFLEYEESEGVWVKQQHELPMSCIESAQHVIRCHAREKFVSWKIEDPTYEVRVGNDGRLTYNIDDCELTTLNSRYSYSGSPVIGEGLVLINQNPEVNTNEEWTCHAIAIVAYNQEGEEFVAIDIYADESEIKNYSDWRMSYFKNTEEFYKAYKDNVGGDEYCQLAILKPYPRT